MPLKSHPSKPPFLVFLLLSVSQTEEKGNRNKRGKKKQGGIQYLLRGTRGGGRAGSIMERSPGNLEAGDEKGRRRRISNCGGEGALFLEGKMAHTARPSSPFINTTLQKVEGKGRKFVSRS